MLSYQKFLPPLALALSAAFALSAAAPSSHPFSDEKEVIVPSTLSNDSVFSARADFYADSVLQTLSTEQRLAQLIMPMVYPKRDKASLERFDRMVQDARFGGLLWQKGTPEDVFYLTNRMIERAEVPMLTAMDGEWGLSMRFSGTIRWPRNIVLGAADNELLAYRYGRATGKEAKRLGIHVNFAPVIDVNSNPKNPVIGTRSFGSDPDLVTRLGIAYARGLEREQVLATAKHFPGHGDTDVDSHKALPVINKSRAELEEVELKPFREYIKAGLGGVMVAHLTIPALGTGSKRASSASPEVVTDLLQKELGFEGLIFTDALEMKGIVAGVGSGRVGVEVFKAGSDILLAPTDPFALLEELKSALAKGEITSSEVDRRARKVLRYKFLLGIERPVFLSARNLNRDLNSQEGEALMREIYEKGMTLVKNENGAVPVKGSTAFVRYGASLAGAITGQMKDGISITNLGTGASAEEQARTFGRYGKGQTVIVAVTSSGVKPNKEALIKLAGRSNLVLVFMTSPYTSLKFGEALNAADAVAYGYDNSVSAQRAMGAALSGAKPFTGKLPIELAPYFPFGSFVSE